MSSPTVDAGVGGSMEPNGAGRDGRDGRDAEIGRLGMRLFLASLGMLFAAGLLGHLIIRFRQPTWPPEGAPPLPGGLWISTFLLAVTSVLLWRAERAVRGDRLPELKRNLVAALLCGVAFLVMQAINWRTMATAVMTTGQDLFTFSYWALTVLHAVHVLGGLVPLAVSAVRAGSGRYGSLNTVPIHNVALYWHFLGLTWLGILVVLLV